MQTNTSIHACSRQHMHVYVCTCTASMYMLDICLYTHTNRHIQVYASTYMYIRIYNSMCLFTCTYFPLDTYIRCMQVCYVFCSWRLLATVTKDSTQEKAAKKGRVAFMPSPPLNDSTAALCPSSESTLQLRDLKSQPSLSLQHVPNIMAHPDLQYDERYS